MGARSAQEIWDAALGELQIQVSKPNFRIWLKNTFGMGYQDEQFLVGVPNTFVAEYLDKNLRSLVEKTLVNITHQSITVQFKVATNNPQPAVSTASSLGAVLHPFNPKYTFANFVVGNCNHLAFNAAMNVAENPGTGYNPLFIYGGAGLGKTHLLHAIGHQAVKNSLNVLYASSEQFTNDFVTSIREKSTDDFRNKYRNVDMLLVDDIRFISGKEQTRESFFHTFNELHMANRQIVITSDSPPQSIPTLQDRLRSRFEWGLVAGIQPPDSETRLSILRDKAAKIGANVTAAVLEFIAQRAQQNIRELEGALNRVVAYAKLFKTDPTIELATQALTDIASKARTNANLTPAMVVDIVATRFQLDPADLKGRRRDRATATARQVAMYLAYQETNYSLAQIGQAIGGRDHSTVIHACKKVASSINTDSQLQQKLLDIRQELQDREKI